MLANVFIAHTQQCCSHSWAHWHESLPVQGNHLHSQTFSGSSLLRMVWGNTDILCSPACCYEELLICFVCWGRNCWILHAFWKISTWQSFQHMSVFPMKSSQYDLFSFFQLVVSSLQIFATKVWIWLLASFLIYTFWYFGLKLHKEMVTTKENAQYQPSQIDFFPAQAVVNQGIPSLNTVKTTLHILYLHCDNEL